VGRHSFEASWHALIAFTTIATPHDSIPETCEHVTVIPQKRAEAWLANRRCVHAEAAQRYFLPSLPPSLLPSTCPSSYLLDLKIRGQGRGAREIHVRRPGKEGRREGGMEGIESWRLEGRGDRNGTCTLSAAQNEA
jgi:hypothetical protein